jgi:hypothetical protein
MKLYIFGNGNISFGNFQKEYLARIEKLDLSKVEFHLADFRGTDTLMMEFLKTKTSRVTVYHIGERPRYFPDKFKTLSVEWTIKGNYTSDSERDEEMIKNCTHFLAIDYNSDEKRKSGTAKNIEMCLKENKTDFKIVS